MQTVRVATYSGPGARPQIRSVHRPDVPDKAALIQIGACGVCGTDLHILKGHWPSPLPWPFTLGHELAGVIVEKGNGLEQDYMGNPLSVGSKVMLPPLMSCGVCHYCVHYPAHANRCLNPTYYGRYLPFEKPPHLWGGWAEMVFVDLEALPATKIYLLPDAMPLMIGSLSEPLTSCIRALNRAVSCGGFRVGDVVVIQGSGPIGAAVPRRRSGNGGGKSRRCRRPGKTATRALPPVWRPRNRFDRVPYHAKKSGSRWCGRRSAGLGQIWSSIAADTPPPVLRVSRCSGTAEPTSRWASSQMPARSKRTGIGSASKMSTCSAAGLSNLTIYPLPSACWSGCGIDTRGKKYSAGFRLLKRDWWRQQKVRWPCVVSRPPSYRMNRSFNQTVEPKDEPLTIRSKKDIT